MSTEAGGRSEYRVSLHKGSEGRAPGGKMQGEELDRKLGEMRERLGKKLRPTDEALRTLQRYHWQICLWEASQNRFPRRLR